MRQVVIGLCILWAGTFAGQAFAQKVSCPAVIAEKGSGTYSSSRFYSCFKRTRDAVKKGYRSNQKLLAADYSGWWRFGLKQTSNSCDPTLIKSEPTFFMQLSQNSNGLFAGLCPGGDRLVGLGANENGFQVSRTAALANDSRCGGPAEVQYIFRAEQINPGVTEAEAQYSIIRTCLTGKGESCRITWSGSGKREPKDHRFWPDVAQNVTEFEAACSSALSNCSKCHG